MILKWNHGQKRHLILEKRALKGKKGKKGTTRPPHPRYATDRPAVLLKKEFFLKHFPKNLLINSVRKIIEQLFKENLFNQNTSSGCFCLYQQFPKKIKEVNILKVI